MECFGDYGICGTRERSGFVDVVIKLGVCEDFGSFVSLQ